jgi:hypothetical protein
MTIMYSSDVSRNDEPLLTALTQRRERAAFETHLTPSDPT